MVESLSPGVSVAIGPPVMVTSGSVMVMSVRVVLPVLVTVKV